MISVPPGRARARLSFRSACAALFFPIRSALAVFFLIPFFGNFAGGRYMEILNIPLAASVASLTVRARRKGVPPPRG